MKIYDCFTFFNEIETLKFRLEFLDEYVDKFVISEANITFSGKPKKYIFEENIHIFDKWIDKIIYLKFEPDLSGIKFNRPQVFDANNPAWKIESQQRNFLINGLKDVKSDDLIFISDVDEIFDFEKLPIIKEISRQIDVFRLGMQFHYFYMNCKGVGSGNSLWTHPFCMSGKFIENSPDINQMRSQMQMQFLPDAGWHFSYLGGKQAIIEKIESFSHQELNTESIKEDSRIEKCIELGLDPFDRTDHQWAFFHVDSYPPKLSKIMRKYPRFLKTELL